jgi:hypothetical protein
LSRRAGAVACRRGKREVEFKERIPNCLLVRRLRAIFGARVAQTRHAVLRPSEALAPAPQRDSLGEDDEVLTVCVRQSLSIAAGKDASPELAPRARSKTANVCGNPRSLLHAGARGRFGELSEMRQRRARVGLWAEAETGDGGRGRAAECQARFIYRVHTVWQMGSEPSQLNAKPPLRLQRGNELVVTLFLGVSITGLRLPRAVQVRNVGVHWQWDYAR